MGDVISNLASVGVMVYIVYERDEAMGYAWRLGCLVNWRAMKGEYVGRRYGTE